MSKILVARSGNLGFVKVVGRGSFQNAGCLKAFYEKLLKDGANRFVVDLDACTYLDSTFLGTLLPLGRQLKNTGNGLHILNVSARNLELLRNLGLDRLIHIDGRAPASVNGNSNGNGNGTAATPRKVELNGVTEADLQEIKCPVPTREEAAPNILEAHQALMEFDPRNVPKFKDVVEFLREDLGQPAH
jgi:anti-sigma B factor antagonist